MENVLIYCLVTFTVVYCPGPMTMFSLANGMSMSKMSSIAGILGGTTAYIAQILITFYSLKVIASYSEQIFQIIKIFGALYFFWMAYKQFTSKGISFVKSDTKKNESLITTYLKGLIIAGTNPKSIIFFSALFPQFIVQNESYIYQFLLLSSIYLLIQFTSGLSYVFFGEKILSFFSSRSNITTQTRVIGGMFLVIGVFFLI